MEYYQQLNNKESQDIQTIDKNQLSDLHQKAVVNERRRMNFDLRTSALDQSSVC